jgi:hypothetical protein
MMTSKTLPSTPRPMAHVAALEFKDPAIYPRGVGESAECLVVGPAEATRLALALDLDTGSALAHASYDPDRTFDLRSGFVATGRWNLSTGA